MQSNRIIITDSISRSFNTHLKEIDPYDVDEEMIRSFDNSHNTNYFDFITNITTRYTKQEYELYKMTSPICNCLLYTTNSKGIQDVYYAEYETDLKKINIYLSSGLNYNCHEIEEYAFKNMNMESITIFIPRKDNDLIHKLLSNGYIPLFDSRDNSDIVPLMIEKAEKYQKKNGGIICV